MKRFLEHTVQLAWEIQVRVHRERTEPSTHELYTKQYI